MLPTNTNSVAPFFTSAGVTPSPPANISATVAYDCEIAEASVAEPLFPDPLTCEADIW